jgi:biotin carboxyl carrier protein
MKYIAVVEGTEHQIEIEEGSIRIDGQVVSADLERVGEGNLYSLLVDGKSYELIATEIMGGYVISLDGVRYEVPVTDERTLRLARGGKAPEKHGKTLEVKSPIPGLIVKVLVEEGEEVEVDQPLVILEAMKMENEIRAPREGGVKEVRVSPGVQVGQGEVLVVLE